mmetsp:Transcript_13724/g.24499  ORF Transcript_13724/g.24499 Transcript_13724/m.24499 type:complete len:521 (-) Transcript_13724:74-1636(-)|eukprot:CAMPEP_0184544154 /NCGR_PEP_ID=MMETSP0199_2-20130426/3428_1 /TAXON_ID=1112570 /ORGANISM="Thraustochytrium sp., Strain LLF1b" /LENGTH=520 /DNA_ID=CAMNT_0026938289 /DNA_START=219 /DNA_END=1781 /DNA_ORIENTATION=-
MRVVTPQIAFHQRDKGKNEPILAVATHPQESMVATAGSDNEVKLWKLDVVKDDQSPFVFLANVAAHTKSVNSARFSPDGTKLATCSDDGLVCVMELALASDGSKPQAWSDVSQEKDLQRKYLRGHTSDAVDVAWSRDSTLLVSGSIDGTVILWDVNKAKLLQSFAEHGHYVQGVAWDPFQHYFCSQSADRSVKIFKQKVNGKESDPLAPPKFTFSTELVKRTFTKANSDGTSSRRTNQIYIDDSVATFFRRPCWSPDGGLLVVPAGQFRACKSEQQIPTTYVYSRGKFSSPALHLPGASKPSIGAAFSPVLFSLREGSCKPWYDGDFRMLFAVATLDSVLLYDTQHRIPIAAAEHLHLSQITDIAWTADGLNLLVSSNDGYCSILALDLEESGKPLEKTRYPEISLLAPALVTLTPTEQETSTAGPSGTKSSPNVPSVRRIVASPVDPAGAAEPGGASVELSATGEMNSSASTLVHTLVPKRKIAQVQEHGVGEDIGASAHTKVAKAQLEAISFPQKSVE